MGLNPGRLNQQVTIQVPTETRQAGGGKQRTWDDVDTVWAEVLPANGGEAFAQGVARNTMFFRITIRFRTDVTPRHRLLWNGQYLNIRTCADPDQRRESLLISAESGVPEV